MAGASFAVFRGLHWGLQLLPTPESVRDRWMWQNIFVSLIHSLLSGTGALVGCGIWELTTLRGRGGKEDLED